MAGIRAAGAEVVGASVGGVELVGISVGALEVWSAVTFGPSGMNKSGTYTLPSTSAWHTVPTWVVRSGFPDTVIVNDGIEVPAGVEVNISGRVTFGYAASFSDTMQMRVMAGAEVVGTAVVANNGTSATLSPTQWVNDTGSTVLVTFQAYSSNQYFGRLDVAGGANTYLIVEPV